ncbi:N-glycosylase-DNA lyase protein [Marine Group I thaumarchaeote SCGC RSA3]|uniref:DNA-(apurinic or apyrimidinic site) lyase n=3 Tax=Marine Group I TaxID=905826 RepID=A0A081RL54_9ARCH|nr:N-glycosylase-DNA lyase protein [Marine Group I thaumarchaeote SCGC AAA799-N04]KFM15140.1 N-glycosylase-DNA lyase protein [Marine Group I thaumarchaeote SCGC AAA799-D11]KFM16366.1 N-glycosylase-DNA lyase protein [Marine Group I thaumarchaeote SCGC RSA3]
MKKLLSKMQINQPIDVENSINSGQVFLWRKNKEFWYGVNGQDILQVDKNGKIKSLKNHRTDFFRNKDNFEDIIKSISKDKTVKSAVKKYPGLRIIKQDPFQCLISFIVSSNSNIQKIKTNLENISQKFGEKVEYKNQEFFLFPDAKTLSKVSVNEIKNCGVGYRAKFIKDASRIISSEKITFEDLEPSNYFEAKKKICTIPGIGNKVADCILLFSLDKLESFPLDRWMIRILEKYYSKKFQIDTKTITEKQYDILHEKIVDHFGPYAGYAQQFLFKMERENYQKKWL